MTAFSVQRIHDKGGTRVETGFRSGEVKFRVRLPGVQPASLSYDEALNLADALDAALDQQETEPLIHPMQNGDRR